MPYEDAEKIVRKISFFKNTSIDASRHSQMAIRYLRLDIDEERLPEFL